MAAMPCSAKSSWSALKKSSLRIERAPFGLPAGLPDCPGFHFRSSRRSAGKPGCSTAVSSAMHTPFLARPNRGRVTGLSVLVGNVRKRTERVIDRGIAELAGAFLELVVGFDAVLVLHHVLAVAHRYLHFSLMRTKATRPLLA